MKTRVLYLFAALIIFASCTNEETATVIPASDEFYCSIENEESTRTSLGPNNNVTWSAEDQLVIFKKSSIPSKYQISESHVGKTSGSFYKVNSDEFNAGSELDHNVALYPYQENIEITKLDSDSPTSNYKITGYDFPAEQTYVENSFANGAFPMAAVSDNYDLTFRNICGGIKLQLKGTQKVKSIMLQGKNNERLSGSATVTAYTNDTKPAISMDVAADTYVSLNCGDGIQLSESTATEFIIALPPVLFSKGFIITVTNSNSQTYTVETDKANTVLRSSLLVMPAFKLGETPGGDSGEGLVEIVLLDRTSLTMAPGTSYAFESEIDPTDATYPTLTWSSSDNSVATVDQSGKVTAVSDGTATITALAVGGANATCSVTVKSATVVADTKYVVGDADYGYGIVIGDVVWAPVNCGYEPANGDYKGYPYGKLYQWGRKYGQGYRIYYYEDEAEPEIVEGPVMPSVAQSDEKAGVFFTISAEPYDWCKVPNNDLWNSGTEEAPVKTDTDPCPVGWRVPTYKELKKLEKNSSWTTNDAGQEGRCFSGEYTFIEGASNVFFPAAGCRSHGDGLATSRDDTGYYWSSRPYSGNAYVLDFNDGSTYMSYSYCYRARGHSVRCVQE